MANKKFNKKIKRHRRKLKEKGHLDLRILKEVVNIEAKESEEVYPIVKIDRTTTQDILPMLLQQGIFSNYNKHTTRNEIIEKKKRRLRKTELTFQEERKALSRAKIYQNSRSVIRDYHEYCIIFPVSDYFDHLKKRVRTGSKTKKILKEMKLYRLAHRLAYAILSEVYIQRTYTRIVIPKEKLIAHYLGYNTSEKHIYQDIKQVLNAMRWCRYKRWKYEYTNIHREVSERGKIIGAFLSDLREDHKRYTLSINGVFVGSVQYLFAEREENKEERKTLFSRGYHDYPTRVLPLTKNYSLHTYILTNFLIKESGNNKLKEKTYKVVAYRVEKYIKEAHIKHTRKGQAFKTFVDTLKRTEIIHRIKPTIKELRNMNAKQAHEITLYIWIPSPIKALDKFILTKLERRGRKEK